MSEEKSEEKKEEKNSPALDQREAEYCDREFTNRQWWILQDLESPSPLPTHTLRLGLQRILSKV